MIRGEKSLPPTVIAAGWKRPDKVGFHRIARGNYIAHRTGPSNSLAVAYVLHNDQAARRIQAQTCSTRFSGTSLRHNREYIKPNEEGGDLTEIPTEKLNEITIPYANIVRQVEIRQNNQMFQGDLSLLAKGGWRFDPTGIDSVATIAQALALQESALALSTTMDAGEESTTSLVEDHRFAESWALETANLPSPIWRRLQADEEVFEVVDPFFFVLV